LITPSRDQADEAPQRVSPRPIPCPVVRKQRRLLVLCPYPQGVAAGQRLKYEQYFDDWRAHGYEIIVSSFMDPSLWRVLYERGHYLAKVLGVLRGQLRRLRDICRLHRFDIVYIFMWVTPFGTSLNERLTRFLAPQLIYDIEDNVLIGQKLPKALNPSWFVRLLKGSGKAAYLVAHADHVISSSPFLNDYCLALNRKRSCTYITSSVDVKRYVPKQAAAAPTKVTIGWTGTFSSIVYLDLLRPVFARLASRRDFRLVVIGNFEYHFDGIDLGVIRWTKEREIADLQEFDIGVYPLPVDEWVLGKSGLKAIQYMAMGLPTVATRVGTTPMIIDHGVNGLLVQTEDEWVQALELLIDDPGLRQRLGAAARETAAQKYSIEAVREQYLQVLSNVAAPAAPLVPAIG
jgi:L-malate glycosyltransferase